MHARSSPSPSLLEPSQQTCHCCWLGSARFSLSNGSTQEAWYIHFLPIPVRALGSGSKDDSPGHCYRRWMIKHEKPESRWAVKGGILAGDSTKSCCDYFVLVTCHRTAPVSKRRTFWRNHTKHQIPAPLRKTASLRAIMQNIKDLCTGARLHLCTSHMQCIAIMEVSFSSAADLHRPYAEASLSASVHDCRLLTKHGMCDNVGACCCR